MMISDEDRRARACAELTRGAPVVLVDATGGVLAAAAETISDALLAEIRSAPLAELVVCVTNQRARVLRAPAYDGDLARLPVRADLSAQALRALADPTQDLEQPLLGPHRPLRGGAVALHRAALRLCKIAKLLPSAVVGRFADRAAAEAFARTHDLAMAPGSLEPPSAIWREVVGARVPIAAAAGARLRVFRRAIWADEHYALEIGQPRREQPVLTRLHSACVTGDLFGSRKCDCGPQLRGAIARIADEGAGVLLYLLQEGRGIGLANKMRAYRLQDQGFDTVEANHRLGFEDEERMLGDGAAILRAMGFRQARVMTNNPRKLSAFESAGIEVVERIPLIISVNPENVEYLKVKARKSGHLL